MNYGYQEHGYKSGHQRLFSTLDLNRQDQDAIDRLSDISGPLRPGENFDPYITCYPLPSKLYFVLARTWQDLSAPRAGCVLTKSLIIPMKEWSAPENTLFFFGLLLNTQPIRGLEPVTPNSAENLLRNKVENAVDELTEALFLEERQPILFFGNVEAQDIIIRLYSVFWDALKSSFATCSYALSQRSIAGSSFDLLFAPGSVKARFSDWTGRRIEGTVVPARHRWTKLLTDAIFRNNPPSLIFLKNDQLVSDRKSGFNEQSLRLNLLWNDLLEKADSKSPFLAVLGMLDIINSLKEAPNAVLSSFNEKLLKAIQLANIDLMPPEAWGFYNGLLSRNQKNYIKDSFLSDIRSHCKDLAFSNPKSAVEFLTKEKRGNVDPPMLLISGLGDGLGDYFVHGKEYVEMDILDEINSNYAILLIEASQNFRRAVILNTDDQVVQWYDLVQRVVADLHNDARMTAIVELSAQISSKKQVHLLNLLLESGESKVFEAAVIKISFNTQFKVRDFDEIILRHAMPLNEFSFLAKLILGNDKDGNADILLIETIKARPILVEDLLNAPDLVGFRKSAIISEMLSLPDSAVIDFISTNLPISRTILKIFDNYPPPEPALAFFLFNTHLPATETIDRINKLSINALRKLKPGLLDAYLRRAFKRFPLELNEPFFVFLDKLDKFDFDLLFSAAVSDGLSSQQIIKNTHWLFKFNGNFRNYLIKNINVLSRKLAGNLGDNPPKELVDTWIDLLYAAENYKRPQKEAAVSMLDFAFRCKTFDPTDLLKVSFPIVYKSFLKGKPITHFIPSFFFSDWDKCKTLREDLVKLYLKRPWAEIGLIYVADSANILNDVVKILFDKSGGKDFISNVLDQAARLPGENWVIKKIQNLL